MARAESITFQEFRTRFNTEDTCRAELFRLRFPNGFVCPKCGCTEYYPVRGRNMFQCRACRHQTSITAGSAADGLVLGDLPLCHGQTRHFCRPAESYAEHLLWVGVVSFARKMARLCSRGCRLLKMSPAARSSRSLTKLLRRAQKSNATATDSIAEKTEIRSSCAWQEPSLHLVHSCIKPISKFQNMTTSAQRQKTPRDPTSGIAGVRGEDLRFRPLAGALEGFPGERPGKRARRIWRRRRKKRKGLKRAAVWPHYGFACVKRFCCSSARSRMPRVRQKSGFLRSQPSICVIWARRSSSVERCR